MVTMKMAMTMMTLMLVRHSSKRKKMMNYFQEEKMEQWRK